MTTYISLLRGINLGSRNKIKMPELKALYETLGFQQVATYVQSGNVVFQSPETAADLASKIHVAIEKELGLSIEVIIRNLDEWRALIDKNPFGNSDTKALHVTLLSAEPNETLVTAVKDFSAGADRFHIQGANVYLYCPDGYGRSKLNNAFWEKKLKVTATTRNWNTVSNLLDLAETIEKQS